MTKEIHIKVLYKVFFSLDNVNNVYHEKLNIVEELLQKKPNHDDLDKEVITKLGNGIGAHESVPTAIYCFLRAQNEIPGVEVRHFLSSYKKLLNFI